MEENVFKIVWGRLINWMTPTVLKRPKWLAFLNAFAIAIRRINKNFEAYRKNTFYIIGITTSAVDIQRALNDRWDIVNRGIQVEEGVQVQGVAMYLPEENKEQVLYQKNEGLYFIMYTKAESMVFAVDFVIKVPVGIPFNLKEMEAFVSRFCTQSKTFLIQIV